MYLWGTVPNAFQKTSEIKWSSYWKSEYFHSYKGRPQGAYFKKTSAIEHALCKPTELSL